MNHFILFLTLTLLPAGTGFAQVAPKQAIEDKNHDRLFFPPSFFLRKGFFSPWVNDTRSIYFAAPIKTALPPLTGWNGILSRYTDAALNRDKALSINVPRFIATSPSEEALYNAALYYQAGASLKTLALKRGLFVPLPEMSSSNMIYTPPLYTAILQELYSLTILMAGGTTLIAGYNSPEPTVITVWGKKFPIQITN